MDLYKGKNATFIQAPTTKRTGSRTRDIPRKHSMINALPRMPKARILAMEEWCFQDCATKSPMDFKHQHEPKKQKRMTTYIVVYRFARTKKVQGTNTVKNTTTSKLQKSLQIIRPFIPELLASKHKIQFTVLHLIGTLQTD